MLIVMNSGQVHLTLGPGEFAELHNETQRWLLMAAASTYSCLDFRKLQFMPEIWPVVCARVPIPEKYHDLAKIPTW